jgi:hypothetical protein
LPAIEIDQPLPGLEVDVTKLPEGTNYWDQIIPSRYGNLHYSTFQFRNGTLLWETDLDEKRSPLTMIRVQSGTGIVLDIISPEGE